MGQSQGIELQSKKDLSMLAATWLGPGIPIHNQIAKALLDQVDLVERHLLMQGRCPPGTCPAIQLFMRSYSLWSNSLPMMMMMMRVLPNSSMMILGQVGPRSLVRHTHRPAGIACLRCSATQWSLGCAGTPWRHAPEQRSEDVSMYSINVTGHQPDG